MLCGLPDLQVGVQRQQCGHPLGTLVADVAVGEVEGAQLAAGVAGLAQALAALVPCNYRSATALRIPAHSEDSLPMFELLTSSTVSERASKGSSCRGETA